MGFYDRVIQQNQAVYPPPDFVYPMLYNLLGQWQCPPQWLQSPPHCKDFPFFLSRTILLIASPTAAATRANVTTVPTLISIPCLSLNPSFLR